MEERWSPAKRKVKPVRSLSCENPSFSPSRAFRLLLYSIPSYFSVYVWTSYLIFYFYFSIPKILLFYE